MCERWQGLGITREQLTPGTLVMVPVGTLAAAVNGQPCIVALAEVMRQADPTAESGGVFADPGDTWWLNVHMGPGVTLPQMYRAEQILGVPAHGLTMTAPPAPVGA